MSVTVEPMPSNEEWEAKLNREKQKRYRDRERAKKELAAAEDAEIVALARQWHALQMAEQATRPVWAHFIPYTLADALRREVRLTQINLEIREKRKASRRG